MSQTARGPGAPPDRGRVAALDGVRALGVLSVIVHHSWVTPPATLGERLIVRSVNVSIGVNVFLVLSGLLVTRSLLGARGAPHAWRDFFIRRQLRIAPLYYGFLLVALVLIPWLFPSHATHVPSGSRVWLFTYLANFRIAELRDWGAVPGVTSIFWSLAMQEQFFLIWAPLALRCSERTLRRLCLALIAGAPIVRALLQWRDPTGFAALMLLPARADTLALGAYIALVARLPGGVGRLRRWSAPVGFAALALLALMVWPSDESWSSAHMRDIVLGLSIVTALAGAVGGFALTVRGSGVLARALGSGALRRIGRYSYCMYVVHMYALSFLANRVVHVNAFPKIGDSLILGQLALTAAAIVLSFLIAWLSWELFERHFVAFGERFRSRRAVAAAPPVVAPAGTPFSVAERDRVRR